MDPVARIIDANANRAREALRVLEDVARFGLDDGGLSAELKNLRHGLRETLGRLPIDQGALLASRDTDGDVGVAIRTEAEYDRRGLRGVAAAAAARATEGLRSIAEAAKTLGAAGPVDEIERIRYRVYDVERRLLLALGAERRQWRLCVLITEALCTRRAWEVVAQEALAGGADCLQLREKMLDGGELLRRARVLRGLTRDAGASLIVNDRVDVALAAGADGVHVGQSDLPVQAVRAIAGFRLMVGVSTGRIEDARRAAAEGADYCGVGPMFATTTKGKPVLAGPGYLARYLGDPATGRLPHLAIGGIDGANIGELAAVGCRGVAVSSAVCGAEDPRGVCRDLVAKLGAGRAGSERPGGPERLESGLPGDRPPRTVAI